MIKYFFVFVLVLSELEISQSKELSKRSTDCNGENEMFVQCGKCGASTCSELGYPKPCAGSSRRCNPGCICIDGYAKNDTGDGACILIKDCPSCGGDPNAESGCGNHCGNSCSDYMEQDKLCLSGCRFNSCRCRHGYVYDDAKGKCIKPEECPYRPQKCPENEEWTKCAPVCPPQSCESIYSQYHCEEAPPCQPGCKCKDGYLRNGDDGDCILSELCHIPKPSCGIDEEYKENNTRCEDSCPVAVESEADAFSVPPPRECQAFSSCVCKDGYLRDNNFTCVEVQDCPKPQVCAGENESVNYCSNSCEKTCKTRFQTEADCEATCSVKCSCDEGFLRHDNGSCVPETECSPPICNDDEEYIECGTTCEKDCDNFNNTCNACAAVCKEGCFCKTGTVRAGPDSRTCVLPEECPPKNCTENEHYEGCPKKCPPETCNAIWGRFDCTKSVECCEPKCRCNEGFFRNESGLCITTQQCIDTRGKNGN